jgi:hypothetical protein
MGDPDLQLHLSTPTLLQPLIARYALTTFVLLHASYPFTRELGWLAAVYANVYADFGLVFSVVSAHGGRETLQALLEMCPTNKMLWSCASLVSLLHPRSMSRPFLVAADGHWWPESFYLGSVSARTALFDVSLFKSTSSHRLQPPRRCYRSVSAVMSSRKIRPSTSSSAYCSGTQTKFMH